jgi:hypothetical protein
MTASGSEISSPSGPAFTGMALDRASTLRGDPAWIAQRLEDPATRAVAAGRDGVLIATAAQPRLLRRPLDRDSVAEAPDGPILLGLEDGALAGRRETGRAAGSGQRALARRGRARRLPGRAPELAPRPSLLR